MKPQERVRLKPGVNRAFPIDAECRAGTVIVLFTVPLHDPDGMKFATILFDDGDGNSSFPVENLIGE